MIFRPDVPVEMKAFARETLLPERLAFLERRLAGRVYLLEAFTVADAYLVVVLNWAARIGIDLTPWPAVAAYQARLLERPAIARAMAEETALHAAG